MKFFQQKNKKKSNPLVDLFLHTSEKEQLQVLNKVAQSVNKEQKRIVEKYRVNNPQ